MPETRNERRRFQRVATDKPVTVQIGDTQHSGTLLDISFRGLLLRTEGDWAAEIGSPARALVLLDDQTPGITMDGEVAHVEDGRVGLRCLGIDLDSARILRRMVELNLSEGHLLERELSQLISG